MHREDQLALLIYAAQRLADSHLIHGRTCNECGACEAEREHYGDCRVGAVLHRLAILRSLELNNISLSPLVGLEVGPKSAPGGLDDVEPLLPLSEVLRLVPYSDTTIYLKMQQGTFPRPVALGEGGVGRRVAWRKSDVMAWIASRPQTGREGQAWREAIHDSE